MHRIQAMLSRLSDQEKRRLERVYAPVAVGTHPSNTWADLCVLPDGEIRVYGHDETGRFYLSSADAGFTWKRYDVEDNSLFCSGVLNPHTGRWFNSYYVKGEGGWQNAEMPAVPEGAQDWQTVLSDGGPGMPAKWVKIADGSFLPRPGIALSTGRILIPAQIPPTDDTPQHPVVARSDDNGESWQVVSLETAPAHEAVWPHLSTRWQNGACEPTLIERKDGSVLMIVRTTQDVHYMYESFDGGETWTAPQPTNFHGTNTQPTLMRLTTGEMLFFFCNTQPLAEVDKTKVLPPLGPAEMAGSSEDVFTNRDANHAAISSDDGKTWKGFRELYLNPLRNANDFRISGGNTGNDKSVHQFQAVELPFGKILLCCGQHEYVRRMLIFDPKWLLETERSEDFRMGLEQVSTQVYVRSISGYRRPVWNGHCAWNRTNGAMMLPDPDGTREEAVYIETSDDARLVSPMQGVVWNFPAAKKGVVSLRIMPVEDGLSLSLTDRWFNPTDPYAPHYAAYTIEADAALCPAVQWSDIELHFDETGCEVVVNGKTAARLAPQCDAPNGLCYLILQSPKEYTGRTGAYLKKMAMKAN